ncbi:MAG: hypothetical protein DWQ34_01380 [Planctomycetota bacterium]|nr:MAG: hypothetical protein DWQ34_01380 [Planctomycetota bacterium]REK26661.1 MAG: hypothetical protein DWQ41_08900 [Planctomycetota bacterium]REK35680.1 MAG: hypothetical protein DWQ45_11055 [Planctomycetota bacterium]
MPTTQTAPEILERHFLEIRCGLLNLCAALDRIDRSAEPGQLSDDRRMQLIRQGIDVLASDGDDRAERLQLLFSDSYEEGWNR